MGDQADRICEDGEMSSMDDHVDCPQCHGDGTAPHPCPYAEDVHNDSKSTCTCCEECMTGCAEDV